LETAAAMAEATARAAHRPLLKIKLGGDGDAARGSLPCEGPRQIPN